MMASGPAGLMWASAGLVWASVPDSWASALLSSVLALGSAETSHRYGRISSQSRSQSNRMPS